LSGRGRLAACEIVGIEPRTVTFDGDPFAFVIEKSKDKTYLSKSQWTFHVGKVRVLMGDVSDTEMAVRFDVDDRLLGRARSLLLKAEPHIIGMVETGEVKLRIAHEAVKNTPRATQATWTTKDVIRIGREVAATYPSKTKSDQTDIKTIHTKPLKPLRPKPLPPSRIDVPYGTCKFPTAEESGAPPPGSTLAEHDKFSEKYGRVPLHPKTVKEMLDCDSQTSHVTHVVSSLANSTLPNAEEYFAMIDQMLAWVPQTDKKNGEEKDFARMARTTLARMEKNVIGALNRLTELKLVLERRNSRSAPDGAPIGGEYPRNIQTLVQSE